MTVRVGVGCREDCESSSHRKREVAVARGVCGAGNKTKETEKDPVFPLVVSLRFVTSLG